MFFDNALINGLNLLFQANPTLQTRLANLSGYTIILELPLFKLQFSINPAGKIEASTQEANCIISFPLATAAYLIHQQELKTFQQIKITGNTAIAKEFLMLIKEINYSNLLYQADLPISWVVAVKVEDLLKRFIDYIKLVIGNASTSGSQYLQYEVDFITDKYLLSEFYAQVDNLTERSALLTKRVERLLQK